MSEHMWRQVQYEGAKNVAHAAKSSGVDHLVHMSALGSSDNSACKYQQSKGWGEDVVKAAFPGATIIKPSLVFGAGDGFFNKYVLGCSLAHLLYIMCEGSTSSHCPSYLL